MNRWLYATAAVMTLAAVLFWLDRPGEEPRPLPRETSKLAQRIASHPTDWQAANALAERALEEESPRRVQAWRAASELTMHLAPHFAVARHGFIRAGLFHWYELGPSERLAVLNELAPLLRDPAMFHRVGQPLFELTGDLAYLRRFGPHTIEATEGLRQIAATNGRFAEYRELRGELVALRTTELARAFPSMAPSQIVASLPLHPTTADEPLLHAALRALHEQPLEVDSGHPDALEALIDYALRHRLSPLDGLAHVVNERTWASAFTRGQLARALGQAADDTAAIRPPRGEVLTINGVAWDGACGPNVCRSVTAEATGPLSINVDSAMRDEVPPYIECYVDDALVWEGPIEKKTAIPLVPPGRHRVEITLVNPLTRNRAPRAVRLS